jgi:type I thyroxine 5'-deiodinase
MYREYGDRAAFFVVYIEEAHASDVWQMAINEKQNVVFASPRSYSDRENIAAACVRDLKIEFPAILDDFNNSTERAYTAWPDRLYVIDRDGKVAYESRPGPFGFKPADAEQVLRGLLGPPAQ